MMKKLLLLGGMTTDVTILYYQTIARVVRARLGAKHGPKLYLYSADLEEMVGFAENGDWESFAREYTNPVSSLSNQVDGVVMCAILAHKVCRPISEAVPGAKILHIADYLALHIKSKYPLVKNLGLLGPKSTMLGASDPDWFVGPLQSAKHGFTVLVPESQTSLDEVNRGMMEEVAKGGVFVTETTKAMFIKEAKALIDRGAQAIVLGSTDLGFALRQEDVGGQIPFFEPASIHAEAVANWACDDD